jgi:shikimate kinase
MASLMESRHPFYAEADFTVDSTQSPHADSVDAVLRAIAPAFQAKPADLPKPADFP